MIKHCLLHVHAVDHPSVSQLMDNVKKDLHRFNGELLASVTDGPNASFILMKLQAMGFSVFNMNNNAGREKDGFFGITLPALSKRTRSGVVLFAHTKGTSHNPSGKVYGHIRRWADVMWHHNVTEFDRWIAPHINNYNVFGTLRRLDEQPISVAKQYYHYSGSFYWMRLDGLIANNWKHRVKLCDDEIARYPQHVKDHLNRYFTETFPSTMFPPEESVSVMDVTGDPYSDEFWDRFAIADAQLRENL